MTTRDSQMSDDFTHATRLLPPELEKWRQRHGISDAAWRDLQILLAPPITPYKLPPEENSEAFNQTHLRLMASGYEHVLMWRNNLGAYRPEGSRRVVRYGLCNDSAALNDKFKSSDLVGGTPLVVKPHHVGMQLLIFTAIEVKSSKWDPNKNRAHERAQLRFINAVRAAGGIGFFCNEPQQYLYFLKDLGVPRVKGPYAP